MTSLFEALAAAARLIPVGVAIFTAIKRLRHRIIPRGCLGVNGFIAGQTPLNREPEFPALKYRAVGTKPACAGSSPHRHPTPASRLHSAALRLPFDPATQEGEGSLRTVLFVSAQADIGCVHT